MDIINQQFSVIYDQYIEKIYRFVYLKVNSQELAEDITSKVFLKGFEAYKAKQDIKNPGAFLYQIARNSVIDYYRVKDRTENVSPENLPEMVDTREQIYDKAVVHADIEMVKSVIQNLKKDYQDVIILHYLEDMHSEEIAKIMDKPVGTIRVLIHRGLEALRDQLSQES